MIHPSKLIKLLDIKVLPFILLPLVLIGMGMKVCLSHKPEEKIVLPKAKHILVEKSKRLLHLFDYKGNPIKTYSIALGFDPLGPKIQEGDGKTPEGVYSISGKLPTSQFHLSLRISYPTPGEQKQARKLGVNPGGDIMIHGLGKKFSYLGARHRLRDWTLGCIAVTNEEIEEIYSAVGVGTSIKICP